MRFHGPQKQTCVRLRQVLLAGRQAGRHADDNYHNSARNHTGSESCTMAAFWSRSTTYVGLTSLITSDALCVITVNTTRALRTIHGDVITTH